MTAQKSIRLEMSEVRNDTFQMSQKLMACRDCVCVSITPIVQGQLLNQRNETVI